LPFVWDPRPGYPTNFYVYESNPLLDPERYSLEELVAQRSVLLRRMFPGYFNELFLGLDALRRAAGWGTPAWHDRIAQVYVTNLTTAARVSRGLGAQFLGFLQPLIYFKRSLDPAENAFVPGMETRAPGMQRHCVAVRERVRAALDEAPADVKPMLFDLTAIYDDTADRVFLDFVHTTQAARLPVVNAIAREILERRR
jgi:hypothetical protein